MATIGYIQSDYDVCSLQGKHAWLDFHSDNSLIQSPNRRIDSRGNINLISGQFVCPLAPECCVLVKKQQKLT